MCGSKAYNNPTAATWYVNSYTYTGHNGAAVSYTTRRGFTSTTDSTNYSLSDLSTNKFLMYDAQGGTVSPSYASSSPAALPTPTREGYTFMNWNTKADGTGTAKAAGTSYSFSSTTTLYAIWAKNVEVTFSSEGSIDSALSVSAGAGTTATLPSPTRTMQWLEGWYTAETGGTKNGSGGASFTVPVTDTTYYAHWNPKYGVSYNANGGTVSPANALYEGTALTLPTPTNGSKTFEGWFTAAEGGTKVGTGGDSYTPTANIELFAQWSNNILVTYNANGGSADTNSATYDNVTPITLPTATWAGHQFNGWYTAASGGTKAGNAGASYTPTEPVTLYAQWTAYTVTYNANGGSVSSASASAGSNGSVTLPTPTRTGYTFNGWYTAASGGTKIGNAGASYTPTANITLYAQWKVNSYKVTITTSNSSTAVSVNGTTVNNGGSVAYNSVVKVVLSYSESNSLTFTVKQGNNSVTCYSNEACTKTTTSTAAGTYYFKMPAGDVTINSSSSSSCIVKGTMITMADGSQKAIENITLSDCVLAWDFINGEYVESSVFSVTNHGESEYEVLHLSFDSGSQLDIISDHGLFDVTEKRFVNIDADNVSSYIGHEFVMRGEDGVNHFTTLISGETEIRTTTAYSLISTNYLDVIANDMLTVDPSIYFLFPFDVTDDLAYDAEGMAADIETFGLLTYEEFRPFAPHMSETQFYNGNGQYIKVALGKGIITMDEIIAYAQRLLVDQEYLID